MNFEDYLQEQFGYYARYFTEPVFIFDEGNRFEETGKLDDPPLVVTTVHYKFLPDFVGYDCREQEGTPYITNVPPQSSAGTAVLRYT